MRVRLLLWYDDTASFAENSMPGYTDALVDPIVHPEQFALQVKSGGDPYGNSERHAYCKAWWKKYLPGGADSNTGWTGNPNLQIMLRGIDRDITSDDINTMLNLDPEEKVMPSHEKRGIEAHIAGSEYDLLTKHPTHHQKPVLIDYAAPDEGSHAVGYVMGLNSITDYWDTKEHLIDEGSLRETASDGTIKDEIKHDYQSDTGKHTWFRSEDSMMQQIHGGKYQSLIPYQDYACRIEGDALGALHQNFENGWNAVAPQAWKTTASDTDPLPSKIISPVIQELNKDWRYQHRRSVSQVQIVRTQPVEQDKTIKKLYFQATNWAYNYIYIENQYFFYPEFARHLKECREKFCDKYAEVCGKAGKTLQQMPALYLFIVIPLPEEKGMVPRTFETLAELGAGDEGMPGQAGHVDKRGDPDDSGNFVLDRASVEELQAQFGLNVSVARLCTSGLVGGKLAYREIYIHSKLMIIDDVFVTLGSANINQRSMSVDSEMNIAATDPNDVADLRRRIFNLHSGDQISGDGGRNAMPDVFKDWNKRMNDNYIAMAEGDAKLVGHLMPFMDKRKTSTMYASLDTNPSSDNPAIPQTMLA